MYSMSPYSGPLISDEEAMEKYRKENHWGLMVSVDLGECDLAKISSKEVITQFAIDLAKHINMKTEWLERILAEAKELGLSVIGFDELP